MLDVKRDRNTYFELLKPQEGYEIDKILTTTYSLDINALKKICIDFGFDNEHEKMNDNESEVNNRAILVNVAIEKMIKKMVVICQANCIKAPSKNKGSYIDEYFDNIIIPISMDNNKNFHPKIWIVRYINKKNSKDVKYKLLVGSRNLTLSRLMETQICIDGELCNDVKNESFNEGLIEFIKRLNSHIKDENKSEQYEEIKNTFIKELKNVNFNKSLNKYKINNWDFLFYDKNKERTIQLDYEGVKESVIISPFIDKSILNEIIKRTENDVILVTRFDELINKINEWNNRLKIYILKDELIENINGELSGDIHSKMYIFKKKNKETDLYIGSANATNNAFYGNMETMVKLSIVGEDFFNEIVRSLNLDEDDPKSCFEKIKIEDLGELKEDDKRIKEKRIDKEIDDYIKTIINEYSWKAEYNKEKLEIKIENYKADNEFKLFIKPYLSDHKFVELTENEIMYNIDEKEVSEFWIIEVRHSRKRKTCILKVHTDNMPIFDKIISNIRGYYINNEDDLIEYIIYKLSTNEIDMYNSVKKGNSTSGHYTYWSTTELYEKMLKKIYEDKNTLNEIVQMIEKIDITESKNIKKLKELTKVFKKVIKDYERRK